MIFVEQSLLIETSKIKSNLEYAFNFLITMSVIQLTYHSVYKRSHGLTVPRTSNHNMNISHVICLIKKNSNQNRSFKTNLIDRSVLRTNIHRPQCNQTITGVLNRRGRKLMQQQQISNHVCQGRHRTISFFDLHKLTFVTRLLCVNIFNVLHLWYVNLE